MDPASPERLTPPPTKGHFSVARLARWWYVACASHELRKQPLARTVVGLPLVLFRDSRGHASALLDRCPHRNVPLSLGRRTADGQLECRYHGWCFDGAGTCTRVPGLLDEAAGAALRRVEHLATREQDGLVWVFATPDEEPIGEPFALPLARDPQYSTSVREVVADCSLHAAVENALDVPHTAFLHRGLFRGTGRRNEITAIVRRSRDSVEAEFQGEPRPAGLVGRLLSPSGGIVEHWDRFVLPSIAQVEYRLGNENHLVVTSMCTPESDFRTRMIAVISFRLRLPSALVKPLLQPLALRIFRQDAAILARQSEVIHRFGGERFQSTEIDLLGSQVWRLLREAESNETRLGVGSAQDAADAPVMERTVRFVA